MSYTRMLMAVAVEPFTQIICCLVLAVGVRKQSRALRFWV